MRVRHPVKLKEKERNFLTQVVRKGQERARRITRCRILLLSNEGKTDSAIMEALDVARNTVRQVRERYINEGLEAAIRDRPRTGAPIKYDGRQRAKITALACSNPPEGHSQWSLRLLADKIVELNIADDISHVTVDRILKKTNSNRT
jgi:putative transposase